VHCGRELRRGTVGRIPPRRISRNDPVSFDPRRLSQFKAAGFAGIFTRQPSRRRFTVRNLARTPRRERHWAEAFNEFSPRYLFEMRPAALVSSAGEHYENQPTSVVRVSPAPAFRSGARCRRVQVLTGRKSNETKTWNAARNVGHVYWAGGGARCRELTASRQPGDRRERREFRRIVTVIEGPLDETRSNAVIAEIKKTIPNKPIRYLVNTHNHFDHLGGTRTYVAEGATVITDDRNRNFYQRVVLAPQPRTLSPDRSSQAPFAPTGPGPLALQTFSDECTISDGQQSITCLRL